MSEILRQAAVKRGVAVPPPPHTPAVLGELAASLFLHPVRDGRKAARELGYLAPARAFTIPTTAGNLAAWEWGTAGRPLVGLLHGWEGHGAQLGAMAAPLVAAGFRVLTFDAPGHGDSPGDECSVPQLGRLVAELEPVTGRFTALIAHSMGAAGAAMATLSGVQPRGLVFLAPPLSQLHSVERTAARLQLEPAVVAAFQAALVRRTGLGFAEADMRQVARRAPCPLLVLHDPEDSDTRYADAADFVALWQGARIVPCPGRGHYRLLSTPDVVRQAVEFITGLP